MKMRDFAVDSFASVDIFDAKKLNVSESSQ